MNTNNIPYYLHLSRGVPWWLVLATLLFLQPACAKAQRTMRGQWYGSASASCTAYATPGAHPGIELGLGRYLISSRWTGGIRLIPERQSSSGSLVLAGGWMQRLCATRSRSFSIYGGGTAFIGADYDDAAKAVEEIVTDSSSGSSTWTQGDDAAPSAAAFTYGLEPVVEAELFFSRKAAFIASLSVPVRLATRLETLSLRAGAGIRINF